MTDWAIHLLLLAEEIDASTLEALALSREAQVYRPDDDTLAWSGAVTCAGPRARGPQDDVPAWVRRVVEFRVPVERGDPIPRELRTGGGVLAAFPDGEPIGLERATLETAMAFARRLGGAVRTDTGVVVAPDPNPDLVLFSSRWLAPPDAVCALTPFVDARLQRPGEPPSGSGEQSEAPAVSDHGLEEGHRRWLHAEADAFDSHALDAAPGPGGPGEFYALHAPQSDGGLMMVNVDETLIVPIAVDAAPWCDGSAYVYEVRYYPPQPVGGPAVDEVDAWRAAQIDAAENPAVIAVIENCAWALRTALGDAAVIICDDDGFLIALD